MLTLTWEQLNDGNFARALRRLADSHEVDKVTAYRAGRICDAAIRAMKALQRIEKTKKSEHGLLEGVKNPEAEKKYDEEMKKILANEKVQIKVHPLEYDKVNGLSGNELVALEKIFKVVPEIV